MRNGWRSGKTVFKTFFKMGQPRPLFRLYFRSFQAKNTIFTTSQCEKCHDHPIYGAGIRTNDLFNVGRLPWPLDQGSRPGKDCYSASYIWTSVWPIDNNQNCCASVWPDLAKFHHFGKIVKILGNILSINWHSIEIVLNFLLVTTSAVNYSHSIWHHILP